MKIDLAYSIELERVIDPEEAHEGFWEGELTDKQNFCCTGCSAPITCANMDRVRSEMKKAPYFILRGEHILGCSESPKNESQRRSTKSNGITGLLNTNAIRLLTSRPESVSSIIHGNNRDSFDERKKKAVTQFQKQLVSDQCIPRKYSIRPVVTLFNGFNENDKAKTVVLLRGATIPFQDLFKQIGPQTKLESVEKIYFGKAWVEKKETGISVRYLDKCSFENVEARPSIFLNFQMISSSVSAAHWKKKIEAILSQTKPVVTAYALSTPALSTSQFQGATHKHINLSVRNMDFVEFY